MKNRGRSSFFYYVIRKVVRFFIFQIRGVLKGILRLFVYLFPSYKMYALFGLPHGVIEIDHCKRRVDLVDTTIEQMPETIEPSVHENLRPSTEKKEEEPPGYYSLEGGMATEMGGQLTAQNKIIATYLQSIHDKTPEQHDLFRLSASRFFPRIYNSDERVVTLCTSIWQSSFYHWVHEVLPRLAIYKKAGIALDRLFVDYKAPFQRESLALLGIDEKQMIKANEYQAVRAPEVIASSIAPRITSWSCQFLVESFRPHLKKDHTLPKRIYLSRDDAERRCVLNEKEVRTMLEERYGFVSFALTKYTFQEQMNLFYNAEIIVAPHGAGLSHLVFADPKVQFLELFSPLYVPFHYWRLANVKGIRYHYLFGESEFSYERRAKEHPIDRDIFLDPLKVERGLLHMMARNN